MQWADTNWNMRWKNFDWMSTDDGTRFISVEKRTDMSIGLDFKSISTW